MSNEKLPMAAAAPTTDYDDYQDDVISELGNQDSIPTNTDEDDDNDELTIRMKEHNNELVNSLRKLDHKQYFEEARIRCFPEVKLDFMQYFLLLTTMIRKFIVPGDKLREYGVINTNRSSQIKDTMKQYGLIEDEDYRVQDVLQPVRQGGFVTKKEYMLTKKAFKFSLMRARNSYEYAHYYYLLELVNGLYYEYLDKYNAKLLIVKNAKIDEQTGKIDQLLVENQDLKADIQRVLERTNHIVNQNNTMTQQNEGLKQQANDLSQQVAGISVQNTMLTYKVDSLVEHLYERNPKLPKENDQPTFLLVKILDSEDTYKVYRTAKSQVERLLSGNGERYKVLINQFDPNPGNHYKRFHAFVKKELYEFITAIKRSQYMSKAQKEMQLNMYTNQPPIYINGTDIIINPKLMTEERLLSRFELINTLRMRINGNVMKKSNAEQA